MEKLLSLESEVVPVSGRFVVSSKRYGEVENKLNDEFEAGSEVIEGKYKVEVTPEVLQLCQEIRNLGGRAFLVGGCVRDAIMSVEGEMKINSKDFDVEVYGLNPSDLMRVLTTNFTIKDSGTVGKAFEVIKVYMRSDGTLDLDVSIPRIDSQPGESHRDIVVMGDPTMSIREAARRRDIRINSCCYDPLTETVYDPFGAVTDIRSKEINVTDKERFQDDPLRVLRVMQFAGRFGYKVGEETLKLCREMVGKGMIDHEPQNRITDEFKKMLLKGRRPSLGLEFAWETGLVERYWPELYALCGVQQEVSWHPEGDVWTHTMQVLDAAALIAEREGLSGDERLVFMFSALAHDLGKPGTTKLMDGKYKAHGHEAAGVEPTMKLLARFANPDEPATGFTMPLRQSIAALVADHMRPKEMWMEAMKSPAKEKQMEGAIRKVAFRLAKSGTNIYMLSLLAEADQRGRNGKENKPLERDEVVELGEWQLWLMEKSTEMRVTEKAPERICTSEVIMRTMREKRGGPWVGVVSECVYQDQLEGLVFDTESATERTGYYVEKLRQTVEEIKWITGLEERVIWDGMRSVDDPRVYA